MRKAKQGPSKAKASGSKWDAFDVEENPESEEDDDDLSNWVRRSLVEER